MYFAPCLSQSAMSITNVYESNFIVKPCQFMIATNTWRKQRSHRYFSDIDIKMGRSRDPITRVQCLATGKS